MHIEAALYTDIAPISTALSILLTLSWQGEITVYSKIKDKKYTLDRCWYKFVGKVLVKISKLSLNAE